MNTFLCPKCAIENLIVVTNSIVGLVHRPSKSLSNLRLCFGVSQNYDWLTNISVAAVRQPWKIMMSLFWNPDIPILTTLFTLYMSLNTPNLLLSLGGWAENLPELLHVRKFYQRDIGELSSAKKKTIQAHIMGPSFTFCTKLIWIAPFCFLFCCHSYDLSAFSFKAHCNFHQ